MIRFLKPILLLAFCLVPMFVAAQNGPFLNLTATPVGAGPVGVAIGALSLDGTLGIATANNVDGTVSIVLKNSDGSYRLPLTLATNPGPGAIAIADVNKDGIGDLIVATTSTVQVFLGTGYGTFLTPFELNYGQNDKPSAIQVADFNGDGILDLAIADTQLGTSSVTIFLGKGDGTFAIATPGGGPAFAGSTALGGLVAGDFDGNGTINLAVITTTSMVPSTSIVSILSNDGKGNLTFKKYYQLSSSAQVLTAADFNGDGRLDLAATEAGSGNVAILLGNGDGTFQTEVDYPVGQNPYYVAAADLNGDGKVDLITANLNQSSLSVLLGNGDGTFQAPVNYPALAGPAALAIADLNQDGRMDVVVTNNTQNTVQVFLSSSIGSLTTGSFPAGGIPSGIAAGDFNNDGIPDLAVATTDGNVTVYLGDGHGGFPQAKTTGTGCYSVIGPMVAGNFFGNGNMGLVFSCVVNFGSPCLLYVLGNGDGTLVPVDCVSVEGDTITNLKAGDFNGDGMSDFLATDSLGLGLAGFGGTSFIDLSLLSDTNSFTTGATGDFNGDGLSDIFLLQASAFGNLAPNGFATTLLGSRNGSFVTVNPGDLGAASTIATGDLDGDGLADVVAISPQQIESFFSNGDGTFRSGPLTGISGNPTPQNAVSVDFNGDARADLVAILGNALSFFPGKGDGSFSAPTLTIPTTINQSAYQSIAVADFDKNGSPDVAFINDACNCFNVLLNKATFEITTTTLNASVASAVTGQTITLTATVSVPQGVASGTVKFKLNNSLFATVVLSAGEAQTTFVVPTAGTYTFSANYSGGSNFVPSSSSPLILNATPAPTTTSLKASGSLKLGQAVSITATVNPLYSGAPTGTIQFFADGEPAAAPQVSNGAATFSYTPTTMGKHMIEASYSGDSNFLLSAGVLTVTVGKGASTVAVTSSANPALYGTGVTLTATVTDSEGAIATGPVVFKEGATIYGTVSLSGGSAQFTLPSLSVGTHKITAQYGGDTEDATANGTISELIQGLPTTTTVVTNAQAAAFGQSVTFTATITATSGTPDGTLTFKNGSAVLGTVAVSGGQAQLSVSTLSAGTHTITAAYNGGTSFAASSGTVQQIIEKVTTTTAVTSSANPAAVGTGVSFTAVVSSAAAEVPTGNVTFKDGKTTLGAVALVNGQGQLSTSLLAAGSHNITASYAASTNYAASSATLTQTIQ